MTTKRQIAEDLLKATGALVSVTDLANYLKVSRNKARNILAGCHALGKNTGRRYYYEDVAEKLLQS